MNVDKASGTKEGKDVKGSKTGKNKTKKVPTPPVDKVEEIEIRNKIMECLQKTGLFKTVKANGVDISIQGDKIILSGRDTISLKKCSEKVKDSLKKVICKSTDITDLQSQILSKEAVVVFIDNHLGMKDKVITWEVVPVLDQVKLNVYAMDNEKMAADISSKIMACIIEKKIAMEESKNEWFKNMLKNESSKLVTANTNRVFIIYSTIDVHKKYLTEPRQKTATATGVSSVPCQSPITNSADQPSTEKDKTRESTDQPGLTLTGLAATANQLSDNTLATNSSTTNFNGGNQPTNQLSQSHGTERSSQNTESAPGTQMDLNQPEPVTCIPLSYWLLQYFEKFGWHIVDDICQKSQVKCTMEGKRLLLNGNQKSVASVKKEVDGVLKSLEIHQEQTYCGKPFLPEGVKQKWIQIEKDKRSEKPVLLHGWVINTDDSKMHILYMMGSITLADVDVILCPVTDKLEPIDDAADAIRTGTCFFILIVILNILLFFSYSRGSHGHFVR